jgi:hypothetical protein
MPRDVAIVGANLALLEQGFELLGRIPDRVYAANGHDGAARPVGPHFRHVLEHYSCFLDGRAAGRIDYDARAREAAIESDRAAARERIRELVRGLEAVEEDELEAGSSARLECGVGDEADQWSRTSVRRELHFLLSHTIHHYALIGLLLERHGVDPGDEFGVAPSTLKHWRSQPTCAPPAG